MVADTFQELHTFAESIGLKRSYYEGVRANHPHYDLIGKMQIKAIEAGAVIITTRELIELSKKMR